MTREVRTVTPDRSLRDAARLMIELDVGALPVVGEDRLVGMITDRDIAVRGVAEGKRPDTPVRDVMSAEVRYCFHDEDVHHVARNMGEIRVRRLPVMDRSKRLVGIVAIGDIAGAPTSKRLVGEALRNISRAGGPHDQTRH